MVRVGSLPMRILALEFGADIVYTEEIIDFRLLKCQRIENNVLNTIDFIDDDQNVVFRTCTREKRNLVLQLGTASAERALRAAKMVVGYVQWTTPPPVLRVEQSTLTSHPVRNVRLKDTRENRQMNVRDAKL
ncbi:tRNA-dihydrouridine(20) synthase-like [Trichonephila clavipes]|nr:tRNA-dihydrouridine(20) synthase-like [Trichonephila clavipes]